MKIGLTDIHIAPTKGEQGAAGQPQWLLSLFHASLTLQPQSCLQRSPPPLRCHRLVVRRLRATVLLLRISHFTASLHSQFHSSRDSLRLLCQSSIIISRQSPSRWERQSPNKARLVNRWGSLQPLMSSLTQTSILLPTCAATPAVPALSRSPNSNTLHD